MKLQEQFASVSKRRTILHGRNPEADMGIFLHPRFKFGPFVQYALKCIS